MVIKNSVTIKPGLYKLSPAIKNGEVLTIEGDDISVDFNGAVLQGYDKPTLPDQYTGIAIRVKGQNISIKNAIIKGYKTGIIADSCENLHITHCDISYNYKQQLHSSAPQGATSGIVSYQTNENEKDEWQQYGAGIYLKDCIFPQVDQCIITSGQNGLLLTGCTDGLLWNNNFSFLSGIGIGLYRSANNKIMHNRLDWCVNGHSYDMYPLQQYSAGILLYEQSLDNIIAYNSATHCTNGIIIGARQDTTDTREGGSNDNLIYGNDFSYALASGIEMFSSLNKVINNRIEACRQGIWGRYCYNSIVLGNTFSLNKQAIALEQGQEISIIANFFNKDTTGVALCSAKTPGNNPEFQSRDYFITCNTFNQIPTPLQFTGTENITIEDNNFSQPANLMETDTSVIGITFTANNLSGYDSQKLQNPVLEKYFLLANNYLTATSGKLKTALSPFIDSVGRDIVETMLKEETPDSLEGAGNVMLPVSLSKGKNYIIIDEWGPYDFKSPLLWPRKKSKEGNWEFQLLGPAGAWKLKSSKGISLVTSSGTVPGNIKATLVAGSLTDILIELEYTGSAIVTPLGEKIPAGKPYVFRYKQIAKQISGL